ncbi:MAG: DUF2513 domain-containing protein [Methylotenera sp.]|nr:DUF2513 domain-containing protein [Methylotenera sp.]
MAEVPSAPKWQDQSWEDFDRQSKEVREIESRIFGHLELLINNGFVEGIQVYRSADGIFSFGREAGGPRLTWAGHDLLATMRSSSIWESIKSTAKTKSIELTFDTIKSLGALALNQLIGS